MIGNPGDGFALAQKRLGPGRIHHAMRWLGQSSRAFDMLCERSLSRYTHGAVTLLSFVYSYCTDPVGCPLAYSVFVDVRSRVLADRELRGKVRFVSLSFDPTNDTRNIELAPVLDKQATNADAMYAWAVWRGNAARAMA